MKNGSHDRKNYFTASYCAYYNPVKISPNHKTLSDSICLLGFTADLNKVTGISSAFSSPFLCYLLLLHVSVNFPHFLIPKRI